MSPNQDLNQQKRRRTIGGVSVCDSLPLVVAEVVGLSLPNAHKPRLKPKSKQKHKCKLSLPWLWNTKASVGSTRSEPSVRNQQQRWWGKARKFLDNCFHGTTDSKRESENFSKVPYVDDFTFGWSVAGFMFVFLGLWFLVLNFGNLKSGLVFLVLLFKILLDLN